jgi:hypothetical protein
MLAMVTDVDLEDGRAGRHRSGRLAGKMRRRYAAWIALVAFAGVPAVADAAQPGGTATATLHVSVTPRTGSAHTRFAVSFRAAATTGPTSAGRRTYSVTARGPRSGGCQWTATVAAPPSKAGSDVRVTLSPNRSSGWCAGTFHGTVWDVITLNCRDACPASVQPSIVIGKFTFSVTRG